jgi:hypothetical protein
MANDLLMTVLPACVTKRARRKLFKRNRGGKQLWPKLRPIYLIPIVGALLRFGYRNCDIDIASMKAPS